MATRTQKATAKAKAETGKAGKTTAAKGRPTKAPAAPAKPTAARRRKVAKPAVPAGPADEPVTTGTSRVVQDPVTVDDDNSVAPSGKTVLALDGPAPQAVSTNGHGHGEGRGGPEARETATESSAANVADELMRRRSKPIVIDNDDLDDAVPSLPVGRRAQAEDAPKEVLQLDPAPPARSGSPAAPQGLGIPEHFLLIALEDDWDERRERARPGGVGGALVGALLLDLVRQGKLRVQRDRFQVTDAVVDPAGALVLEKLALKDGETSLQAMRRLAKWLPKLLPAYKDRLAQRGFIEHRSWRHLGIFYRSQAALLDEGAQERLRNKLARAIAGGGRPDAATILSLGLLEASGLFGLIVPEGAQAYNRKRLNGLLGGKDVMGYKVDDELKGVQEIAVRTILDNVRTMSQG